MENYDIFITDPEDTLMKDLEDAINFSTLEDLDEMATRAASFYEFRHMSCAAPSLTQSPMDRLLAASAFGNDPETRVWVRDFFFGIYADALLMEGKGIFYALHAPLFGGILLVRTTSYETACRVSRDRLARLRRVVSPSMFGNLPNQLLSGRGKLRLIA